MRLTIQLKLQPTPEQADALQRTLERANEACNAMSLTAWETKTFRQFAVHKLVYQDTREAFGLAAQMVVRCIAKVADAYKLDRKVQRTFRPHGAMAYDDRILSFHRGKQEVSIWTLDGRQAIPFLCGDRQRPLLASQRGETDLALVNGAWYLFAGCEVEIPDPGDVEGVMGIDLGVTNIAVDSDGETHSGKAIKNVRYRHRSLRRKLQRKRTHGARRRLRKLVGQEYRFATWVNHNLSKRIVAKAEGTKRAIALEDLTHIRTRITARRSQRATLHSWAFAQLQAFIVYKAAMCGVPVHRVDPRNTSRTCPMCGCIDKANRKTQASFVCTSCGFAGPADVIAAVNIGRRAPVSAPCYPAADSSVVQGKAQEL
ncbi:MULTISPECIES: RNA-guided endonuclease InsQ/TnpB family protein [Candidatus Chloroploca]|uniref:Transposase n=1 Tax=Candidatus Chloroploca asiatica TaxID=1506545 RepID=A0A2H3KIH9_9CHLR|nr:MULTISPECIES: RNA-guided endonuclease TnpB family protein [Candidatus Chloroploca]PDV97670.1 transposase [Candidatus Chloroploca asiatica]